LAPRRPATPVSADHAACPGPRTRGNARLSKWEGEFPRDPDSLLEQMGCEPSVPRRAATAALAAYPVAAVHFGVVYSA